MERVFQIDPLARDRILADLTEALQAEPSISFAYLHGSFLEGTRFRDVDVGIYFAGPADRHTERSLALSGRLSARVRFPVDVRPLNAAPVSFLFHVFRSGRLVFSQNDELLADLIERTVRQYLDIAPLLRRSTIEAFAS